MDRNKSSKNEEKMQQNSNKFSTFGNKMFDEHRKSSLSVLDRMWDFLEIKLETKRTNLAIRKEKNDIFPLGLNRFVDPM